MGRFLGCHRASELFGRHENLFSAFYRNHPRHHLPGYRQRGAVAITLLLFLFVNQGQLVAESGCELRRFHQHLLDMLVASLSAACWRKPRIGRSTKAQNPGGAGANPCKLRRQPTFLLKYGRPLRMHNFSFMTGPSACGSGLAFLTNSA